MANSTTHLRQMTAATASHATIFNALVDAASPATFGARDELGCSGLTWAFFGGNWNNAGTVSQLANGTLTLTNAATNYIEFDTETGAISANTSGFTAGRVPLYAAVTAGSVVTSYTDYRLAPPALPRLSVSLASDANLTLTAAQARAALLDITSSVSLTATRDIVLPLKPQVWMVANGTTGAQSLQFIGATGTGVTVANAKAAIVFADGSNIRRLTADA